MATRKKSSTKKSSTKKSSTKKTSTRRQTYTDTFQEPPLAATKAIGLDENGNIALMRAPTEPVPVKDYVYIPQLIDKFLEENPDGIYFRADVVDRSETESALKGLKSGTPVIIITKKAFTASELRGLGFEVFRNGKDGKLVGIRK